MRTVNFSPASLLSSRSAAKDDGTNFVVAEIHSSQTEGISQKGKEKCHEEVNSVVNKHLCQIKALIGSTMLDHIFITTGRTTI